MHFGESQLFKIYGFFLKKTLAFYHHFGDSQNMELWLDIKKFQPTSCPGDFRKLDTCATCSPKQTENKFTFQDLAQHFLMKARRRFLASAKMRHNWQPKNIRNCFYQLKPSMMVWFHPRFLPCSRKKSFGELEIYWESIWHKVWEKIEGPNVLQNALLQAPCCISSKWRPT